MVKTLCFIGTTIYGVIASYLIWLLITLITPFLMSWGWLLAIIYWIFAFGLISGLIIRASSLICMPMVFMINKYSISRYMPIVPLLFFGYSAVVYPWSMDFNYSVLQYIMAFSISITAFGIYITIIKVLLFDFGE